MYAFTMTEESSSFRHFIDPKISRLIRSIKPKETSFKYFVFLLTYEYVLNETMIKLIIFGKDDISK